MASCLEPAIARYAKPPSRQLAFSYWDHSNARNVRPAMWQLETWIRAGFLLLGLLNTRNVRLAVWQLDSYIRIVANTKNERR